jgi:branched-chain amino acid transport system permease protein
MNALVLFRHGLPLGVVLRGLVGGGALAIAALGIALVYRIDRVVNFAQAGIGGVAGVCAVGLSSHYGWPWLLSFPVGAVGGAAVGALMSVALIDRMRSRPRLAVTVATVGVAEILAGAAALLANAMPVRPGARAFLVPWHINVHVAPVLFHADTLLAVAISAGVFVGIQTWLRMSASGLAFRAATEAPERARLAGTPVAAMSAVAWSLAGLFAAVAVMLQTQLQGVSAGFALVPGGPSTLLRLLAAAVLGGMGNLRRTFAAGLAIGVLDEVATWTYGRTIYVDMILVGLVVFVLLLSRDARARRTRSSGAELASREPRPVDRRIAVQPAWRIGRVVGLAVLGVAGATVPLWARPSQAHALSVVCVYAMLALSLLVLTGWAGQVSLGQFALAGLGGAVTAVLYGRHGWDIGLALAAGVAVAALAAVVLGLPALRLQGPFFAVTTLGFAVVAATYLFDHRFVPWLVQDRITRPVLWERVSLASEKSMYEASFVALLVVVVAVANLRRSRFGRMVIAVRENEGSAAATGLRPARAKLAAFAVAGGLAGLAGGVYVLLQQGLQVDSFAPEASLRLFAIVVVGGLVSVGGVIGGAVVIRGTELLFPSGWALLASGAGITALVGLFPEGLGGAFARVRDGVAARLFRVEQ